MQTRVLFFGKLKELVGAEQSVELRSGATIAELFERFANQKPELASFRSSVVASRNQEFAPWTTVLEPGDEVAFLPPVSGG
ncbi:MAG TPA: MoaD/ThiS family protein [Candidatus Sulfotelmatobacter sp.]|jgi:molybdopterin converting factor subunit 1|nr:MoaD/ThiS family protein [Candidatus Sulfotelmatobacter sp.]